MPYARPVAGRIPAVPGVLTEAEIRATGEIIAAAQEESGAIGWPDGQVDAWNHVECAMALSVCGLAGPARRAYEWLRATQRADGSWPRRTAPGGAVNEAAGESNHAAYVAVGVWHEYLVTGDTEFVARMWPTVRLAIEYALGLQTPRGEIIWQRDRERRPGRLCAADRVRQHVPEPALRRGPGRLRRRATAGLGTGRGPARARGRVPPGGVRRQVQVLDGLVLPGPRRRGARAGRRGVAGRGLAGLRGAGPRRPLRPRRALGHRAPRPASLCWPWTRSGISRRALEMFAGVQFLRDPDGAYWTGWQFANEKHFPNERSSYTSAAIILAADALSAATRGKRPVPCHERRCRRTGPGSQPVRLPGQAALHSLVIIGAVPLRRTAGRGASRLARFLLRCVPAGAASLRRPPR